MNALINGTVDAVAVPTVFFPSSYMNLVSILGISTPVLNGPFSNFPTFEQLGFTAPEISTYGGAVYGIAVNSQMDESLKQEISNFFANITLNQAFGNIMEQTLGAQVFKGYTYESSVLDNFIQLISSLIYEVLGISVTTSPAGLPSQKQKSNIAAIELGVIIPVIFCMLTSIVIIFIIYMRKRKSKLIMYDFDEMTLREIGNRVTLESFQINWNEINDLEEIGHGS